MSQPPTPRSRSSPARNVADCLAALALDPAAKGILNLTGPAALDLNAIAVIASEMWQVPLRYVAVTPPEFCLMEAQANADPWWTYAFSSMFDSIRQRRWEMVTDDVSTLLGRPPRSLAEVLKSS